MVIETRDAIPSDRAPLTGPECATEEPWNTGGPWNTEGIVPDGRLLSRPPSSLELLQGLGGCVHDEVDVGVGVRRGDEEGLVLRRGKTDASLQHALEKTGV